MTNKEAKEILEWELNNFKYTDNEFVEATKVAIKALEERPKGKWRSYEGVTTCENCGSECFYNEEGLYSLSKFCPTCGADMRE